MKLLTDEQWDIVADGLKEPISPMTASLCQKYAQAEARRISEGSKMDLRPGIILAAIARQVLEENYSIPKTTQFKEKG